jgi:hypothetical protein
MTEILAGWAVFQVELIWVATCSAENATGVGRPQEELLAGYLIGPVEIPTYGIGGSCRAPLGRRRMGAELSV